MSPSAFLSVAPESPPATPPATQASGNEAENQAENQAAIEPEIEPEFDPKNDPNIREIRVLLKGDDFYAGDAYLGLASPDPDAPTSLEFYELNNLEGVPVVGKIYAIGYTPIGPRSVAIRKQGRYVGTQDSMARFEVV